jgi:hypothetical protein
MTQELVLSDLVVSDLPSFRVRASLAPMLGEPRISAPLTSQLVAGQLLWLLERREAWCRVRGEDGYVGWMHDGYLEAAHGDERDWPVTTGAQVQEADGRVRALPFGARIAPDAMVLSGEVYDVDELAQRFPAEPAALCHSAEQWFAGAPYLWGGVSPWGTDCSGFVQAIARLHGIALPRDAWQQAQVGEPIAFEAVRAGDLLFFSDRDDRHVTHVAVVHEADRLVHSALGRGGVSVELLTGDDAYVRRLLSQRVAARRIV